MPAKVRYPARAIGAGMRILTGAGAYFCAAHHDLQTGSLHGHTWEVEAWFEAGNNALIQRDRLNKVLQDFDHKVLPKELSWGEAIAEHVLKSLDGCVEVKVSRPNERIFAKAFT